MIDLTARQTEVLVFIRNWISKRDYGPTVREIGKHFGIHVKAVVGHLDALERKGAIQRDKRTSRGIRLIERRGIPFFYCPKHLTELLRQ